MNVLVINAGSSSLKYQLLNTETKEALAKGLCERIGIDGNFVYEATGKDKYKKEVPMPSHNEAIKTLLDTLVDKDIGVIADTSEIDAIGHRVVHGGEHFSKSVIVTDEVMKGLKECIPLAPLHNPANIIGIEACIATFGKDKPQVVVFDTAFHQTMPAKAFTYAIPDKFYKEDSVRRYGFHGTSHYYVAGRAAAMLGKPIEDLKLVSCHLGNGSSIAAIQGGKCMDTSMGFTPLAGLAMGTRCGDIDAGILQYLMNKHNMDIDSMLNVLNKESGVLGVSSTSSDFRDLEDGEKDGNKSCALALEIFEYQVAKYIGAYAAAMGGVDAVIFTAGVGENGVGTRENIVSNLAFMGIVMDKSKNNVRGKEVDVSADNATVRTLVIPTNEELVIALDTDSLVSK